MSTTHLLSGTAILAAALMISPAKAETSSSPAPIPPESSALLMIEFVNEWLAEDGKLRGLMQDAELLDDSVNAAEHALQAARDTGMPVVHVTLRLSNDYREFGSDDFGLRGAIQRAGTWRTEDNGWHFHADFSPLPGEFIVEGRAGASAFAASNLDNYLRTRGIKRLYLAGYATHVCVESTLREAHDRGYEPVVLSDATAAFTAEQQQHVLDEVVHHFGWSMPTTDFIGQLPVHETSASP